MGKVSQVKPPDGSIYFWMYEQGLRHVPAQTIMDAVYSAGKVIRPKDMENYWSGWYRSSLYKGNSPWVLERPVSSSSKDFMGKEWLDYPVHPWLLNPEINDRWVPCNAFNKPMIKWGKGCMSKADAEAYPNQVYLAENLRGTKMIVIDCDGDHDESLDLETIMFLNRYADKTHCIWKPKMIRSYEGYEGGPCIPASFHLTFSVDRIVPTMHFPKCHIDIIGNKENSLRYYKNKRSNGLDPMLMTPEIWEEIKAYIVGRINRHEFDPVGSSM